jgi:hypothetical protein
MNPETDGLPLAMLLMMSATAALTAPTNILGGLVLGWLCRGWWQVVLAAVVMHGVLVATMLPGGMLENAALVRLALLAGLAGPLAWCAAGFALRRHVVTPGSTAERAASAVAGLVLGGVAGAVTGLGLGELYVTMARVSTLEGAAGYAVFFLFMLPGIGIGAVLGAVLGWRWSRPRAAG